MSGALFEYTDLSNSSKLALTLHVEDTNTRRAYH